MVLQNKNFFSSLELSPKKNVAIIGSSFCSCLIGDYIKSKYGSNVIFYERTKFIGGAWRSDISGNIFSNIIAPTSNEEKKIFKKVIRYLNKKKIKMKKNNFHSYYSNQIVDSYFTDFNLFYKKINNEYLFRRLKVNSICEKDNHIIINNKFKHDYVLFPNYIQLKKITQKSSSIKKFKFPKGKIIRSKHIRIFSKDKIIKKFEHLYYSDKKFGIVDRLQIIKIKNNLFKISGRVSLKSKKKSKNFLINNLKKILDIKNITKTHINTYASINYNPLEIKKINSINEKFFRVRHYNTSSVIGFINRYLI